MKYVDTCWLQGLGFRKFQGLGRRICVLTFSVVLGMALLLPSSAVAAQGSGAVTQLEFLQWLAQLTGDSQLFNGGSTAGDYVQWARGKGLDRNWQPDASLTQAALAEALVHLFGLNPKKQGGDHVRILAREGIIVPADDVITRIGLVSLIDGLGFQDRIPAIARSKGSPHNNGVGNGKQPPPPNNPNGDPHDNPDHPHNRPGHPLFDGIPGKK